MGKQATCLGRWQGQEGEGKAELETDFVAFRGPFRLKLPFGQLTSVASSDGVLSLTSEEGALELSLGPAAARWADAILNPPTLIDKLGLKPSHRIAVLGFADRAFLERLDYLTCLPEGEKFDAILAHVNRSADLKNLWQIRHAVGPKGFLWIVYPKGQADPSEKQVIVAGRGAGLNDVKVCRFSATHTGLKFMWPKG